MSHSSQILSELRSISELVASLPVQTPYQVPSGYFENLTGNLKTIINSGEPINLNLLDPLQKHNTPYTVPSRYFDDLPAAILQRIKLEKASSDEELEILSPLLLQLKKLLSFKIPSGYFAEFSDLLVRRIQFEEVFSEKDELEISSFLLTQSKIATPYRIPEEYFQQLPGVMLDRISHDETLEQNDETEILSPLLEQAKRINPYRLPEHYFQNFATLLLNRIESENAHSDNEELADLSPLLGKLQKTVPFTLPEGYFDEFPSDIIAGVTAVDYVNQELESHAPVVNDLKIKNVYEVPPGYFDSLGEDLLNTVKNKKKAPVISIGFTRKVVRYGIAAVVAGIMSIGAWMFYQDRNTTGNELAKISNDEMINYLESTPSTPVDSAANAAFTMKDEDVKELLASVPDDELQQYLEQENASKELTN